VVTVNLNRLRQGKKIKDGLFGAEFCFDSVRGVEIGYMVCTLINFTNFSVVDVQIYPKNKAKKEIWEEIVISEGTESGKINCNSRSIFLRLRQHFVTVKLQYNPIKVKKNTDREELKGMVERTLPNVRWFDSSTRILSTLLEDFEYIIKKTVEGIDRYENCEIKSRIELFFKVAKAIWIERFARLLSQICHH